jgi:hypothetical protein
MKNIKWSAVFIGLLSGFGAIFAGAFVLTLILWFLLGESLADLRGHPGIGSILIMFVMAIASLVFSGYVTARLSHPSGVRHALLTGIVFAALSLLGGFDGLWVIAKVAVPVLCCVFGAFLSQQR